jgi:hypothetical protein
METETRSKFAGMMAARIVATEAGLFLASGLICLLLNQLNWNGFYSALFIVGFLATGLAVFWGKDLAMAPRAMMLSGGAEGARISRGSPGFLVVMGTAGVLAIALSIVLPLIFQG